MALQDIIDEYTAEHDLQGFERSLPDELLAHRGQSAERIFDLALSRIGDALTSAAALHERLGDDARTIESLKSVELSATLSMLCIVDALKALEHARH